MRMKALRLTAVAIAAAAVQLFNSAPSACAAFSTADLPQVGYHPGGISYYGVPYFANAMWLDDRNWAAKTASGRVPLNAGQTDTFGNPLRIDAGQITLIAQPGQNSDHQELYTGRVVLTWTGDADVRITSSQTTFKPTGSTDIPAGQPQSNGAATGNLVNGQRVYQMPTNPNGFTVEIFAINTANPPKNVSVWLRDPATGNSLINQKFHPIFLARLNDANWKYIRFMGMTATNASPEQDWSDRRRPQHTFQTGVINPRNPAPGTSFTGNRITGVAWEHLVALANTSNKDMWINIPHLATDAYVTNLARLLCFGADANGNPYLTTQTSPVYPPLASPRKIYIEYSNEIWSNGNSFPQGDWAQLQANAQGLTKGAFNARRFSQIWRIFQTVFTNNDRLIKVGAVFTGSNDYTTKFINELRAYGPTLSPAQEPDIIAPTTYFGNGIQDWVNEKARTQAGTADEWFYTTATFDHDNNASTPNVPVSKPLNDPYWTSAAFTRHMDEAFAEWKRRLLSDSAIQGGGFDATGIGGGFDYWLVTMAATTWPTKKPIVAYEGGPSLYTNYIDLGDIRDNGVTDFIVAMNRQQTFRDVYRIHLNLAKAKGLWSHSMFLDSSTWGKYGQWGHLARIHDNPDTSVKYKFIKDWFTEANGLRNINTPQNAVPSFSTPASLPQAMVGQPYYQEGLATGGNPGLTVEIISTSLVAGMTASVSSGKVIVNGTPTATGSSYIFARVKDADGDPVWRTFTVRVVQRSSDPSVTLNFEGLPNTASSNTPEPLDQSGYRFVSVGNGAGSALRVAGITQGYPSQVLETKNWGTRMRFSRIDGRPFDLTDLDVALAAGNAAGGSIKLTGSAPGGIVLQQITNIPVQKSPMIKLNLDWITMDSVEIIFYELPNGTGGARNGAVDNIRFNGTPTPPATVTYQAELCTAQSGCVVSSANPGWTGTGFMDYGYNGTWIEWNNVNVGSGSKTLTFRYANGSGADRPKVVIVNGVTAGNLNFSATANWNTWSTTSIQVNLNSGNNTIRLMANTAAGGANLDSMTVQ